MATVLTQPERQNGMSQRPNEKVKNNEKNDPVTCFSGHVDPRLG